MSRRNIASLTLIAVLLWLGDVRAAAPKQTQVLGHWVFDKANVAGGTVKSVVGGGDATAAAALRFVSAGQYGAVVLDAKTGGMTIAVDAARSRLPRQDMTVEAWVRLDTAPAWAGIITAIQDNGSYERGWGLGSRGGRLFFAVASKAAGRLTYLVAGRDFQKKRWYHVAGTYDGTSQKIYVDGELAGTSAAQRGEIVYPPRLVYSLGAYRDDDEIHRPSGLLHEVRVCARALSADEVAARYQAKAGRFPNPPRVVTPPAVIRAVGRRITIAWRTDQPGRAVLEFGPTESLGQKLPVAVGKGDREATIDVPGNGAEVFYRLRVLGAAGSELVTKTDSFALAGLAATPVMPAGASPYPADAVAALCERAAKRIIEISAADQGFCLVLGCGRGQLAYELAKRSRLRIIGVTADAASAAAAREALDKAGIYGTRVTIHHGPPAKLSYPSHFANLVVSQEAMLGGRPIGSAAEMLRVLRPCGSAAVIGTPGGGGKPLAAAALRDWLKPTRAEVVTDGGVWAVVRRGELPGAGRWTHMYADAGNSTCSDDRRIAWPLRLQWFGRPGPRLMIDRHHRTIASLYGSGRIFIPGDNRVIAVDAYNGTWLWDVLLAGFRRVGAPLDASNLAMGPKCVYAAARDKCYALDAATGKTVRTFASPDKTHWGWIALADGRLFGTVQKPAAARDELSKGSVSDMYYDQRALVTSTGVVCFDTATGERKWTYAGGAIVNASLAVSDGDGKVLLIDSRAAAAAADKDGRVTLPVLLASKQASLVCLSAASGRVVWKRPVDELAGLQHSLYLSCARKTVVIVGTRNQARRLWYDFLALDLDGGRVLWRQAKQYPFRAGGSHGEQNRHPILRGEAVYADPYAFALRTGKPLAGWKWSRAGHGCGPVTASASCMFWRGGNPMMRDLRPGGVQGPINRVTRPGCWVNIIPAGGLVMIPESSSGCSCGFPLQTTVVYAPGPKSP